MNACIDVAVIRPFTCSVVYHSHTCGRLSNIRDDTVANVGSRRVRPDTRNACSSAACLLHVSSHPAMVTDREIDLAYFMSHCQVSTSQETTVHINRASGKCSTLWLYAFTLHRTAPQTSKKWAIPRSHSITIMCGTTHWLNWNINIPTLTGCSLTLYTGPIVLKNLRKI